MLKIKNLTLTYDEPVLENVNLSFKSGEITVLTGTSGSGKSSLLKVINGVIPYFQPAELSGEITYQGKNLLDLDMSERSNIVATVFQNPKTHVACMDNDIYLFDEPSSSLDREAIARFKKVLVKLKEMGKIVIIAEHRLYYLKELMNQLIVIKDKKVTSYPAIDITDDFTKTQNLRQLNEISKTELIESLPYQKHSKKSQTLPASSDLICQNYRYKHRDSKDNIFDFNLGLDKGINFIIGKNGVGKTTFLRCLSGLNKTFKGQTFYEKQPVKPTYDWISEVVQDVNYQLFTESVWSEISIVSDDEKVKKDALTKFGLIDKIERHPQSLSGGEKQRLLLAMAKASNKPIIVLDEPTSGLCRLQMERMIEDLHDMAKTGKLIIVVTHDYELIKNCSGNIIEFVE